MAKRRVGRYPKEFRRLALERLVHSRNRRASLDYRAKWDFESGNKPIPTKVV